MSGPLALVDQISKVFPSCEKDFKGVCIDTYNQGYVVFPDHKSCQESWILLPGFYLLPDWFLGVVFLLLLFYCFFGVAYAADQFSAGIEMITSTTFAVTVRGSKGQQIKTRVPVWNSAVANLTLMALGTSAPEILLATIETLTTLGEPAGELGPACIVGSAAYNLMGISAVCIMAVPDGTYKRIDEFRVFIFTAACSIWAYVWMVICYSVWTPDVITVEEGFITFAFFPLMAVLAWAVDQRVWLGYKLLPADQLAALEAGTATGSAMDSKNNKVAPMPSIDQLISESSTSNYSLPNPPSAMEAVNSGIMAARHSAVKAMSGSRPTAEPPSRAMSARTMSSATNASALHTNSLQVVRFRAPAYGAARSAGGVRLTVSRAGGNANTEIVVHYSTKDHDAIAGVDYESSQGRLHFDAGETVKFIEVKLYPLAGEHGDAVKFHVCLDKLEGEALLAMDHVAVSIIDRVDAGAVCFGMPKYMVSIVNDAIEIPVERRHGMDGTITVEYTTCNGTAVAGVDYISTKGVLTLGPCEAQNNLRLPMHGLEPAPGREFKLKLTSVSGGARLSRQTECSVIVVREAKDVDEPVQEGSWFTTWMDQLKEAIQPGYDQDEHGNRVEVDIWTCLLHYCNITWKVLMSVIPPPEYNGGYPCFLVALFFVAVITALTEQSANVFGCAVGLNKLITGISLVAVGTSLPDTFASRYSAINAPNADAAIGNITGSNSVNVFLGLGLPWVIATLYQHVRGETFLAPAGDLSFSIIIFMPTAGITLAVLLVRRFYLGGELGGTRLVKRLTAGCLIALWGLYLVLSGLRAKGHLG